MRRRLPFRLRVIRLRPDDFILLVPRVKIDDDELREISEVLATSPLRDRVLILDDTFEITVGRPE